MLENIFYSSKRWTGFCFWESLLTYLSAPDELSQTEHSQIYWDYVKLYYNDILYAENDILQLFSVVYSYYYSTPKPFSKLFYWSQQQQISEPIRFSAGRLKLGFFPGIPESDPKHPTLNL